MICAATASTSAASAALRNDSLASPGSWEAACASWEACAISGQSDGQGRCAKGGDDELEERSSGEIFSVHG